MHAYFHRWTSYRPSKPRHPVMRLLVALLGLVMLALFLVFGLFIGLLMLLFAGIRRFRGNVREAKATGSDSEAIEGEYRVIRRKSDLIGTR